MHLTKLHGLGNDFLVVLDDASAAASQLAPGIVAALCDRRSGVGADGLILGRLGPAGSDTVSMTLWNSDGSVAEISGNGLRCLGHAVARRRGRDAVDLEVLTDAGPRRVSVDGGTRPVATVRVEMGAVRATVVPGTADAVRGVVADARRVAVVSVGNPHVVVEVPHPDEVPLGEVGPALEAALGPTNVEFVAGDGDAVEMTVWERGVGVTRACGSGAVASAVAFASWGGPGGSVEVRMPGGSVTVEVDEPVVLSGSSVHVAEMDVDLAGVLDGAPVASAPVAAGEEIGDG